MRAGIRDRVGEIDEGIIGLRPPAPAMHEEQYRRPLRSFGALLGRHDLDRLMRAFAIAPLEMLETCTDIGAARLVLIAQLLEIRRQHGLLERVVELFLRVVEIDLWLVRHCRLPLPRALTRGA